MTSLETSRLVLKPFTFSDTTELHQLATNKELSKWTRCFTHPYYLPQAQQWITRTIKETEEGRNKKFSIHLKRGFLIGAVSLRLTENNEAELGYWLGVEFQGNGFATEAVKEVMSFSFKTCDIRRIIARCYENNHRSVNVMLQCGMRPVRNYEIKSQSDKCLIIYEINA